MTSKDIQLMAPTDISTNAWLKLMALQLSILIESISAPTAPEAPPKRGPGRPRKN
jgi:hypothetical protein